MTETLTSHKKAIEEMSEAHDEHQRSIKAGIQKDIERAVFEAERTFLVRQNELVKENLQSGKPVIYRSSGWPL